MREEEGGEGKGRGGALPQGFLWVLPTPAGLQPSPCAAGAPDAALTRTVCTVDPLVVDALSPAGASFWKEARRRSCTCTIFSRLSVRTPLPPKCMVTSGWPRQLGAWTLALGFHTGSPYLPYGDNEPPVYLAKRTKVDLGSARK